ncbi:hypothetical protein [Candidatus Neptunichlamydia sp. REUL1]|uniref:hypothetical protein n=1 Tax=Candidatus Neptunichlamydia sp. REUL1 TaxID=3064277 RepID=UPI002931439D|nr:hypothetical protein [Candidatus Neptunochlamydia sp. REUL1]
MALGYCNSPFQTFETSGNTFKYPSLSTSEENLPIKISGGIVYLSKSVGYLPDANSKFSPGVQLCVNYSKPKKQITYLIHYTDWNASKSHHYEIPIFNTSRDIHTKETIKILEANIGETFSPFAQTIVTPLTGVEWIKNSTTVTINNHISISSKRHSAGPLIGFKVEQKLHKYFAIQSKLSLSYLNTNYTRNIDQGPALSKTLYHPKSKAGLYFEILLPISKGALCVKGGYEIQYNWLKGPQTPLSWDSPATLRGATTEISMSF